MNIHEEREIKNVQDRQLLRKLLADAIPYWKPILLSFILAALIVAFTLAQPYLIKVAIDDRINGLYQPMIVTNASGVEHVLQGLDNDGWNIKESIYVGDDVYVRLDPTQISDKSWPEHLQRAQVIAFDGENYLVWDWIAANEKVNLSGEEELFIQTESQHLAAAMLTSEQIADFRDNDFSGFIYLGVIFLITVAGAALLNYYQNNVLQYTGQTIIFDIRQKVFKHLTKMQMSFFDKNPVGRLVTRVTHDTEALNQLYSQVIVNLAKEILTLIGIIIIMLFMSVKLTLITFIVIPILVIMTIFYKRLIRDAHRYTRLVLSKLNSYLAENLSGIQIIQMFTREKKQLEKFDDLNEEHYRAGMRATTINSIFNPAIGFLGNIALALLIWFGGREVISGAVEFGVVFAFTQYVSRFFQPLMALADRYNQIQTAMASAERIFDMIEEEPAITNHPEAKELPSPVQGSIQFNNVWFAYDQEEWVLKDINFSVNPGETVAFVGATGAGKSSIINLINRFYDIQKGSIRIDGKDIQKVPLDDLRQKVGIIQQDPFIFTGDVNYNIRLNKLDLSDEDVQKAVEAIQIDDFIKQLPQQYQTPLGEQGIRLSGGQRQLISFIRAYVFSPEILILDEATANIDTETELLVQKALKHISKNRTTLIVAHRLSTIQHADKIIVLHKGQIREIGNHYQLLEKKGLYHKLYELQNKTNEEEQELIRHLS